jgi:hypothetical protein
MLECIPVLTLDVVSMELLWLIFWSMVDAGARLLEEKKTAAAAAVAAQCPPCQLHQ